MSGHMRILHVEDNAQDADLTRLTVERALPGASLVSVPTLADAWTELNGPRTFDVLLADVYLTDGTGLELLAAVRARNLPLAVIMLTGLGDERTAVAALKAGADDYLVKRGDYLKELPAVIESARAYKSGVINRRRPVRVLYAEHSRMDVDLTRRHLSRHAPHIRVDAVETGESALMKLRGAEPYDVLLLDYRLNGLNAIELLRAVRDDDGLPSLPVVLVTGHGDEMIAAQALRLGAADYIVKHPGYLHELVSVLENAHHSALLARHQRALRLSESAHRLSEIALSTISQGVALADAHRRIIYANAAFQRITGYAEADVAGRGFAFLNGEHTDPALAERMREALEKGRDFSGTLQHHRKDGSVFWNRMTIHPILDDKGVLTHFVNVLQDVTAERRLEDQLRQAQKMEVVGQLAGGVAHDFNNLLTVIEGHIGLMQGMANQSGDLADSLAQIARATSRAAGLTGSLLTLSRKQTLRAERVDLRDLVRNFAHMIGRILGETITMDVACGERPAWVGGDPGMIEQVLLNLCVNARDAMPSGGRLRITVEPRPAEEFAPPRRAALLAGGRRPEVSGPWVCLSVTDTGCGIPEAIRERIFDPFFTTKEPGRGTGLGLATVYGIVTQHGGVCAVESEVGQGSTFRICLPAIDAPEPVREAEPAAPSVARPSATGGGATVLVAEDEDSVASLIRLALETFGYRVLAAKTGADAIRLWRESRADLLLTDFVMPDGMTGLELAKRLLAEQPGLPVVLTSGHNPESALGDLPAGERGTMFFLAKPFSCQALIETVRRALDARRAAAK